jgi:hypothetical protein
LDVKDLSSGIYFIRIQASPENRIRPSKPFLKLLLMK